MLIASVTSHTGVPAAIGFVIRNAVPFGVDVLMSVEDVVDFAIM